MNWKISEEGWSRCEGTWSDTVWAPWFLASYACDQVVAGYFGLFARESNKFDLGVKGSCGVYNKFGDTEAAHERALDDIGMLNSRPRDRRHGTPPDTCLYFKRVLAEDEAGALVPELWILMRSVAHGSKAHDGHEGDGNTEEIGPLPKSPDNDQKDDHPREKDGKDDPGSELFQGDGSGIEFLERGDVLFIVDVQGRMIGCGVGFIGLNVHRHHLCVGQVSVCATVSYGNRSGRSPDDMLTVWAWDRSKGGAQK